jgi:purine-binding chemotaxis protein CheW
MELSSNHQYLSFSLDGERYAVSIEKVHEVLVYTHTTPLPGMDAFMKGIVNIRGVGIPVIDLRLMFGMQESPIGKDTAIIVMEIEHDGATAVVGVFPDAVHEVVGLPESAIEPPPRFGSCPATDYIRGVGKNDDGFIVVLDIDRVMGAEGYRDTAEYGETTMSDVSMAEATG